MRKPHFRCKSLEPRSPRQTKARSICTTNPRKSSNGRSRLPTTRSREWSSRLRCLKSLTISSKSGSRWRPSKRTSSSYVSNSSRSASSQPSKPNLQTISQSPQSSSRSRRICAASQAISTVSLPTLRRSTCILTPESSTSIKRASPSRRLSSNLSMVLKRWFSSARRSWDRD